MSLNISFSPGRTEKSESLSYSFENGKITFKETKGKPDYTLGPSDEDSVVGVIHLKHLSACDSEGKTLGEVVCLPKEFTLWLALDCIRQYGQELAEGLIKTDRNQCLLWNLLYHGFDLETITNQTTVADNPNL